MYVPATPLPAAPLVPVGIVSSTPAAVTPVPTALKVRDYQLNVLANHSDTITGTLLEHRRPGLSGRLVALQALGRHGWHTLARTSTSTRGRFRLRYTPRRLGSEWLRLRFAGSGPELASHRRLGLLNVYRLALASWYGGGGSMACGGWLTSSTLGVANKTLPCGTLVTLHYDGRTVRVPVVDRGPYVEGREFDLTEATKEALGFSGVGEVWSTS
ncbi:MAG TPA: septal ring lytic transglycosylase RlpA family protein [Solirubrobacteraceae bacterium]|jgi:rare lipoprotein A|nr:septal ring lytic transglycosylase RlpA family protein [Solirubrobacteraceae bacterium]